MQNKFNFNNIINISPGEIQDLLEKCKSTEQNPRWHPEGNVFNHIKIVYEKSLKLNDIDMSFAALFHDLGKVDTTKLNDKGNWCAYGHEFISCKILQRHKEWIESIGGNFKRIYNIVKEHMRIKHIDEMRKQKQDKLRSNLWFNDIVKFSELDSMINNG